MFKMDFIKLFDEGHQFSKSELQEICDKFSVEDVQNGESGEDFRPMISFIDVLGRNFAIFWDACRKDFKQPIEVNCVNFTLINNELEIEEKSFYWYSINTNKIIYKRILRKHVDMWGI